jgi:23S rRNA (cytosine1962-C5)-methyltransferase
VDRVDEGLAAGDEVLVIDPHGKVLGRGLYSTGAIAVRLFTREGGVAIDRALLVQRIEHAVRARQALGLPDVEVGRETTGCRLIHGEGDSMPGLVVDAFHDTLVVQLGSAGLYRMKDDVVAALLEVVGPKAIIDRTPTAVAAQEGFRLPSEQPAMLHGEPPDFLRFHERGLRYELPLSLGQKTGFYFDQRPLRERIEKLSRGSRVLDTCCYVGPIAMTAARAGAAEVVAVDKSKPAIEVAQRLAELNELTIRFEVDDASSAFRRAADAGGVDIVICDPPKLSGNRKSRQGAAGAYRKLAAGACSATALGGIVAFCSCSANVDMYALQRALALGARDAGRRAVVFDRCFQGPDHPVVAAFPEGLYLKVLLARIEAA